MLIIRDDTGVMIKRRIQDTNHVWIGVTQTTIWIDGVKRFVRDNTKPYGEFNINDCADLLEELENAEVCVKHAGPNKSDIINLARKTVAEWDADDCVIGAEQSLVDYWSSPEGAADFASCLEGNSE